MQSKKSKDPLIEWALQIDPILRKDRDWYDDEIESVQTIEGNKLSQLKFKATENLHIPMQPLLFEWAMEL